MSVEPRASPRAVVGATELGGVLLTDIVSTTPKINLGGSRVCVETLIGRTIITDPSVTEATTSNVAALSMHFSGDTMLGWGGFDAVEESFTTGVDNKLIEATVRLKATPDKTISLSRTLDLVASAHWATTRRSEHGREISTALALTVRSKKAPRPFADLLVSLVRTQDLLSVVFDGFLGVAKGRVESATGNRGEFWNAILMSDATGPDLRAADRRNWPLLGLTDLGGLVAFRRWLSLYETHPRAMTPVTNRVRRGRMSDEVRLLEVASALEYWVAAHRRKAAWTGVGESPAEAAACRVGAEFNRWIGDSTRWAGAFWDHYNGLKHDPSFDPDPTLLRVLVETGYTLLLCCLLNRCAATKRPSMRLLNDYRLERFGDLARQSIQ